jgi:regulator of ribonuclease activity A
MSSQPEFSTCDLCDAHEKAQPPLLQPLPPVFQDFGSVPRFSGPVATVRCFEDNSRVKEAVESPGEGRVLVVDGGASVRRALVGGNLALSAEKNGWAGIVVDGAVRDLAELKAAGIAVRALALMPLRSVKRNEGERDVAVTVQGVAVRPGMWLYADEDGIVLAPRKMT